MYRYCKKLVKRHITPPNSQGEQLRKKIFLSSGILLTFHHLFSLQVVTIGLEIFIIHGRKYQLDSLNILRQDVYIRFLNNLYWNEVFWHAQNRKKQRFYLSLLEWPEILSFTAVQFKIPCGDNGTSPHRNASSCYHPIPQAGHGLGHIFSNTRRHRSPLMQLAEG